MQDLCDVWVTDVLDKKIASKRMVDLLDIPEGEARWICNNLPCPVKVDVPRNRAEKLAQKYSEIGFWTQIRRSASGRFQTVKITLIDKDGNVQHIKPYDESELSQELLDALKEAEEPLPEETPPPAPPESSGILKSGIKIKTKEIDKQEYYRSIKSTTGLSIDELHDFYQNADFKNHPYYTLVEDEKPKYSYTRIERPEEKLWPSLLGITILSLLLGLIAYALNLK